MIFVCLGEFSLSEVIELETSCSHICTLLIIVIAVTDVKYNRSTIPVSATEIMMLKRRYMSNGCALHWLLWKTMNI